MPEIAPIMRGRAAIPGNRSQLITGSIRKLTQWIIPLHSRREVRREMGIRIFNIQTNPFHPVWMPEIKPFLRRPLSAFISILFPSFYVAVSFSTIQELLLPISKSLQF
jgi:hypothetical protein